MKQTCFSSSAIIQLKQNKKMMIKKKAVTRPGITLIEIMVAVVLSSIMVLAVGLMLAEGPRSFNRMNDRAFGDLVTESFVARKIFDSTIRKASKEEILVDNASNQLEVYYYASSVSVSADRYAKIYKSDSTLYVEYGTREPRETLETKTICSNVSSCIFNSTGRSAQMILTLDDGSQKITTVTSAIMHNL